MNMFRWMTMEHYVTHIFDILVSQKLFKAIKLTLVFTLPSMYMKTLI